MGDPRKIKNKFSKPMHPWQKARIDAEKPMMQAYGLVNKKELWKVTSKLTKFKDTAKKLVAKHSNQAVKEKKQLIDKLKAYNLIQTDSMDDLLGIKVEQLLDRRLQTIVFKKGLAKTMKQARQMITHRHITVNGKKVTAPGYLVRLAEEHTITFYQGSGFSHPDHPERATSGMPKRPEVKAEIKTEGAEQ